MHIHYINIANLNASERQEIRKFNWLPEGETARLNKLRVADDQIRSALGLYLLKHLGHNIAALERSAFNEPCIPENKAFFNISHSGSYVVVASCDSHKVGVDIEEKKDLELADFHLVMRPEEIQNCQNKDDFYLLWTQKEAVIKALGLGFQQDVQEIVIENEQAHLQHEQWWLHNIQIDPKYQCTLASVDPIKAIGIKEVNINELFKAE